MLKFAPARIGFEHALDFAGIDAGLRELGPDQVGLFANQFNIQHLEI